MMSDVSAIPLLPVRPNPWRAFGGVWRLTWQSFNTQGRYIALLGMIVLLGLLSLVRIRHGHESDFLPWTVEFYAGFILPVMAFLSGAAAIRDEMKSSTADYVLTRPIRRIHLVVFKYLSQLACLQLFYLVVLAGLMGLAFAINVPDVTSAAPRLLLAQAVALTCFSALGFLFGVLTERYLILGILYAGAVEMAIGHIPTQLNAVSMTRQLMTLLQPLNPNASAFFTGSANAPEVVATLLGYTAIFVTLCAVVFSRREMIGAAGRGA
jgi:ABC-type transport system involved in multi-copper enzyme maturation permease subunit